VEEEGDHSSGIAAFAWKTSGDAPCNSLSLLRAVSSGDRGDPNIPTVKHDRCEASCDLVASRPRLRPSGASFRRAARVKQFFESGWSSPEHNQDLSNRQEVP
jgi:hypothetical protein